MHTLPSPFQIQIQKAEEKNSQTSCFGHCLVHGSAVGTFAFTLGSLRYQIALVRDHVMITRPFTYSVTVVISEGNWYKVPKYGVLAHDELSEISLRMMSLVKSP